jgi:nucleoid DNA-binding protein
MSQATTSRRETSNLLSKTELVERIQEGLEGYSKNEVRLVLDQLAEVAEGEIQRGEDFTVPGVARIKFNYTAPLKKGEKYRKGETYIGFGGIENVAEADSKARKQSVKLRAQPAASLKKLGKDAGVMRKAIAARK